MGPGLHGMARRAEQIELNRSSCAEVYARVLGPPRVHGAKTELTLVGGTEGSNPSRSSGESGKTHVRACGAISGSTVSRAAFCVTTARRSELGPALPTLPLPDKPSVAVLPFTNMSGDPEQEFFSDGIPVARRRYWACHNEREQSSSTSRTGLPSRAGRRLSMHSGRVVAKCASPQDAV
jgi:hypothetical protein